MLFVNYFIHYYTLLFTCSLKLSVKRHCLQAVGYSVMPSTRNRDGIVAVIFSKKLTEVQTNQHAIVDSLQKILGSKPNLSVCVDNVKELPDES